MSIQLLGCVGGTLLLPDRGLVLVSREDGGNLVVNPPRKVWERSVLTADELMHWSFLVAAAGRAMLDVLPQLHGGCINYWEAGNWALNHEAEPKGPKTAKEFRRVHLHLLGRNPLSKDPDWRWGESPRFPDYSERNTYSARYERLTPSECGDIVTQVSRTLKSRYKFKDTEVAPWHNCSHCGYPTLRKRDICEECSGGA